MSWTMNIHVTGGRLISKAPFVELGQPVIRRIFTSNVQSLCSSSKDELPRLIQAQRDWSEMAAVDLHRYIQI
jgi:hypothetical protein